ncbi:hypothetical protein ACSBR2_029466 [Camellia fascicularis]
MADDLPHDDAPLEVPPILSPPAEVEELAVIGADEAAEDLAADFEAEFALGLEPELLLLRMRPFDPTTYHPPTHMMALRGMMCFDDFVDGMVEDTLLREPDSHLSYDTTEYHELPARVCELVDEAGFGLFYTRLLQHMASRALLGALVERWWDTTNSFHFSSTGEMTMTPYDFSMIIGLGVGGDPIPFDMDMG